MHRAPHFTGQTNSRAGTETKPLHIGVQPRRAEPQPHLGRADVGGLGDDGFDRETAVRVVVAQHAAAVSEGSIFAMKRGGKADDSFIERGRDGDDFKS